MKLEITREWFERKAKLEGDLEIGAGLLAVDPVQDQNAPHSALEAEKVDQTRIAFGSLVEYARRKRGYSMEKLAEEAEVSVEDIIGIERDAHFRPEPRTVYQIARAFDLPPKGLMQLSGNAVARDVGMHEQALRFAARSEGSVQSLSKEEQKALEEFVRYLAGL